MSIPKIVALVPLRGGSKRIPGKNIKPLAGKPLAYWACSAARRARYIKDVYVSTDDERIARTVESFGLGIQVIPRPENLATDVSTTEDVILHFMNLVDFDILATIQVTSPLVTNTDLDLAVEQFLREGSDSLLTGVLVKRFFWSIDGRPLNYDPRNRPFTQNFHGSIIENGSFYLSKRQTLETSGNRLGGRVGIFQMAAETAIDIDNPEDWEAIERYLSRNATCVTAKANQIKIIISDFDGVWTDNKVYTLGDTQEAICCSKADSLALDIFRSRFDLPMLVVSKEKNEILRTRCAKLQLEVMSCVDNKCLTIDRHLATRGLSWGEVCYIGNDLNDLECMSRAALTFCPSDAAFEIKCEADYILSHSGGNGAAREMLELLGKAKMDGPLRPLIFRNDLGWLNTSTNERSKDEHRSYSTKNYDGY
jgi:YrbI family 3-deoxy-D-manno-octulosonate 8-phosphate phosphatase